MAFNKHIVLFKGRLVTLDFFIDRFVEFLEKKNISYYLVDTNKPKTYDGPEFDAFISQDNVVMFTFNNIGIKLEAFGENIWKHYGIPVFDFVVDPPRSFSEILLEPDCDIHVLSLDENRNNFIREFYPKVKSIHFVAAAGAQVRDLVPLKDRKIDVIYMGNCQKKDEVFPALSYFPDQGQELYSNAISSMIENHEQTTEEAIRNYIASSGKELTHPELLDVLIKASRPVEGYVRRFFKLQGMYALDQVGVHVDIWGSDWEDDEFVFSDNIMIHERITPEELLHYCADAKISLVFMGWQKRGCSEKNFDSMMNGALCVTDRSTYLLKNYKDGNNIVYFDMDNPAQMALDVKYLLEHLNVAQQIATNGYKTALKYDSWEVRYTQVLDIMMKQA